MTDIIKTNETSLRESFVQAVTEQVGKGVYVWGGNGEVLDDMQDPLDWIERHETSAENNRRARELFLSRIAGGMRCVRAFDCSGLVYWALKGLGMLKSDVTSRGLYALCKPIEESALLPGDLVFHHDGKRIVHVGVWADGGQVECRGRDVGVVQNRRKAGYWNRFGRLPALEEAEQPYVYIRGGSVRVREGDGTRTRCIGIAHRGERFPLLGTAASGWYCIRWREGTAYITNKAQYTEVRRG